jgi:hypothetical protein
MRDFSKVENPEELLFMIGMRPVRQLLFIRYTSSEDEYISVPAVIDESRHKVADNYKVTLKSLIPGFGKQHFYQSDLARMIQDGHVQVYRRTNFQD